jgi:hypothetical protein
MDAFAQNILALRERTAQVMRAFLLTELELGHSLCKLAKCTREQEFSEQYHRAAHTALDAVTTFMWKANLEPSELGQLTAQIEYLKFELSSDKPEIPLG